MTCLVLAGLWACVAGEASAGDPVIPLSNADKQTIEEYLGDQFLLGAVAAPVIPNAAGHIRLRDTVKLSYLVAAGPKKGQRVTGQLTTMPSIDGGPLRWKFANGVDQVLFGQLGDDNRVVVTSSDNLEHGVVARYSPAEPLIITGAEPGVTTSEQTKVKVYDLSKPDGSPTQEGSMRVEFTYVGRYKVRVPAGVYEADLMRWRYDGKIGPAAVHDVQYWFVVGGVGPVAIIQRDDISAMLFYHSQEKLAMVLAEPPEVTKTGGSDGARGGGGGGAGTQPASR